MEQNAIAPPCDPVMSISEVTAVVSYSTSQIYRMMKTGQFPRSVRLGPGRVGWRRSAVIEWLNNLSSNKGEI